jgi:opacity protein-like surface antigen
MTVKFASVTALAALSAVFAMPAKAADLGGYSNNGGYEGSIKDSYAPMVGGSGPCYVRGDVGYSASGNPSAKWPVNNGVFTEDTNDNGIVDADEIQSEYLTDDVSNSEMENTWLVEGGFGCGSGSRGFRGEIMLGHHGDRKFDGQPGFYEPGPAIGSDAIEALGGRPEVVDPLHTSVKSYTLMLNGYKDLGNYGGFTPYLGAGVGVAYHIMDEVYFTDNPNLSNRIEGNRDMAFAWSLMAGVGYQLSHSTVLDVGYRYIDMGSIDSGRVDSAGFVNPKVQLDDIDAHEIKVGLRYHFGGREETSYAPMK